MSLHLFLTTTSAASEWKSAGDVHRKGESHRLAPQRPNSGAPQYTDLAGLARAHSENTSGHRALPRQGGRAASPIVAPHLRDAGVSPQPVPAYPWGAPGYVFDPAAPVAAHVRAAAAAGPALGRQFAQSRGAAPALPGVAERPPVVPALDLTEATAGRPVSPRRPSIHDVVENLGDRRSDAREIVQVGPDLAALLDRRHGSGDHALVRRASGASTPASEGGLTRTPGTPDLSRDRALARLAGMTNELEAAERNRQQLRSEILAAEQSVAAKERQIAELRSLLAQREEALNTADADKRVLQADKGQLEGQIRDLGAQRADLLQQRTQLEVQVARLQGEIEALREEGEVAQQAAVRREATMRHAFEFDSQKLHQRSELELQARREAHDREIQLVVGQRDHMQASLEARIQELRTELDSRARAIAERNAEIQNIDAQYQAASRDIATLRDQVTALETRCFQEIDAKRALEAQLVEAQTLRARLDSELQGAREEIGRLGAADQRNGQEIARLVQDLETANLRAEQSAGHARSLSTELEATNGQIERGAAEVHAMRGQLEIAQQAHRAAEEAAQLRELQIRGGLETSLADNHVLRAELAALREREQAEHEELIARLTGSEENAQRAGQEIAELQEQLAAVREDAQRIGADRAALVERLRQSEVLAEQADREIGNLRQRLAVTETAREVVMGELSDQREEAHRMQAAHEELVARLHADFEGRAREEAHRIRAAHEEFVARLHADLERQLNVERETRFALAAEHETAGQHIAELEAQLLGADERAAADARRIEALSALAGQRDEQDQEILRLREALRTQSEGIATEIRNALGLKKEGREKDDAYNVRKLKAVGDFLARFSRDVPRAPAAAADDGAVPAADAAPLAAR